jgi:hypothetical protein
MRDYTHWRFKLTSIHYYIELIKDLFRSKKRERLFGYVKYEYGEEVKITIYSDDPNRWYKGKIIDINARYVLPDIEESWKVEYYVAFKPDKTGKYQLKYWFLESELRKYSLQKERNSIIEQLLS